MVGVGGREEVPRDGGRGRRGRAVGGAISGRVLNGVFVQLSRQGADGETLVVVGGGGDGGGRRRGAEIGRARAR